MKRFNFKKIFENWKTILALFIMALSVSTTTLFTPSNHPANAVFGVVDNTITIIDLQNFAEDLLESFAESLTEGIVKQEVSTSINSTLSQYHIGSYLQYAANLKNQVFAAQAIAGDGVAGESQLNQYIVRSIISDIDTNPIARVNIDPLYQKAALDVVNVQDTSSITIGNNTQNFLAKGGSFAGNAGGQYFMFADLSQKIDAKAQLAAQQDISTASGNKSTFNCTAAAFATGTGLTQNDANSTSLGQTFTAGSAAGTANGSGLNDDQINNQQLNCALQNPGSYVGSVLAGNLQGLFNRAINPPDNHLSAIAGAIGSAFAGIAQQQLIGGSKGGTLISSTFQVGGNTSSSSSGGNSSSQINVSAPGSYNTTGGDCGLLCEPTDINSNGIDPFQVSTLDPNACTPVCPSTGSNGSNGTNMPSSASCGIVCDTPPVSIGSTPNCGVIACTTGGVQGTSSSNFGTLYALDSSGNVIAGSGSPISSLVKKKSAITLQWNAAEIIGAHYVAFAPCASAQCSGPKDKKDLNGSLSVKAPTGAVQTYTMQIWGVDASGNTTILETDSIAIKTN